MGFHLSRLHSGRLFGPSGLDSCSVGLVGPNSIVQGMSGRCYRSFREFRLRKVKVEAVTTNQPFAEGVLNSYFITNE